MPAAGGAETRLTDDLNDDRHPAWSPDGNWIAWDSNREGSFDIWLMPMATGEADATNLTFVEDTPEGGKKYSVETTVYYAHDGVSESILGVNQLDMDYTYDLITDAEGHPIGGEWTGEARPLRRVVFDGRWQRVND